MNDFILSALSALLPAYAAFFAADLLAGCRKLSAAYWAALPALAATAVYFLQGTLWVLLPGMVMIAGSFCIALLIFHRNGCASAIAVLLAMSLCLSVQLAEKIFCLTDLQRFLVGIGTLLLPALLALCKVTIFPEDYILTKEQKQNVLSRRFYLFPGLVLLIAWQICFEILFDDFQSQAICLMIFTLLLQGTVMILLRQQVHSLHERIENIIDKQYQAELLNFMQVIRSQRHDFNFHTQTIYGMIDSGEYDECKAYVQSMMQTVKSTNDVLPLYHPANSALLNTFREMALQKGLTLEIEIHDNLQFICTSVYETNTILGNLLQNAVDELELHPENASRTIKLLIIKRGRSNIIKVSNSCHQSPEEMSKIFMPGFTTKMSHEGLGLANALRIAEKYDGTLYPEFENHVVHFIAKLPMK